MGQLLHQKSAVCVIVNNNKHSSHSNRRVSFYVCPVYQTEWLKIARMTEEEANALDDVD